MVYLSAHDNTTKESFREAQTLIEQAWDIIAKIGCEELDQSIGDDMASLIHKMEDTTFHQYEAGEYKEGA